jgi:hypothetical protein
LEETVRKRARRSRGNGKFKPITPREACAILHCSDRHLRRIQNHLEVKRFGRRLLINEYSVYRLIKDLPNA